MFNFFRKSAFQKQLDDLLSKKILSIVYFGKEGSVALQVEERFTLSRHQLEYDSENGFVLYLFFNKNKIRNDYYFDRFSNHQFFREFHYYNENNNDYYVLDLKNNPKAVERITFQMLRDVYEIYDEVIYPTIFRND